IHVLPRHVANQIAAGEVVERPASVLKELLENSLDAGATQIDVDIARGGLSRIRVVDNGAGIRPDDLELALSRHATSKLETAEQLAGITSLGFRGEALASIGSVSRLQLTSRVAAEETGWTLSYADYSAGARAHPAAHPMGTTVEVAELFFNTPARRKFMRAERTEYLHSEQVVRRVALSRFDVGLHLQHNRRTALTLAPAHSDAERQRRIEQVCGKAFAAQAARIEFDATGLQLFGWVGLPAFSRSQTDMQYFFVNGRMIRDRVVAHAVRQAYRDLLPPGRHPGYVLHLALAPELVDVNVHPTKHEVRFREARRVHDFLLRCVHEALSGAPDRLPASSDLQPGWTALADAAPGYGASGTGAGSVSHDTEATGEAADVHGPLGTALAQLNGRFLLARNTRGLVLVDVPAARALVLWGRLRELLDGAGIPARPLLIPEVLRVDAAATALLEQASVLCRTLGFDLECNAPDEVRVRQVPAPLAELGADALVTGLIAALRDAAADAERAHDAAQVAAALLSHALGPGGEPLAREQMDALLRALERSDADATSPLMRPAWRELTLDQLHDLMDHKPGGR
ncbi:MAG: DNA mismatch repair endonuclease MutL, partial [Pseudomonadota bacterium]